jgi:glycosyltransferase involved in cell wall biosynthesis
MKPDGIRTLLVVDTPNWAWMFKAKSIQEYLNDEFRKISIVTNKQFHKGLMAKYHSVHFFGWMDRRKLAGKYKGMTAGVSSHNFSMRHPEKARKYLPKYGAITAVSKLIYNELKEKKLNSNIFYCPNGVRENFFTPGKKTISTDRLRIGWNGQPSGVGFNRSSGLDMHGYHNILLPLVKSLKDNKDIEFSIMAKTHTNAIPFNEMPQYYRNLDLYIGTQLGIGTPNTLYEANSCGIPGINIAIGCAPELITDGYNGHILPRYFNKKEADQRVEQFRELILDLAKNRDRLKGMGKNARKEIVEKWRWKDRARAWLPILLNYKKKL